MAYVEVMETAGETEMRNALACARALEDLTGTAARAAAACVDTRRTSRRCPSTSTP